ncbi:MAG: DegV family protein [Lachnospiraceae bacterium]|nr:DegV family protein [Lachnospiraceae bacterium]
MSSKVAVVTDSNSGITQKQASAYGVSVLPMPFLIEGQTYYEDITLTQEEFYQRLNDDVNISTSQPSPEEVMAIWDKALDTADEVVYIPMSSGLSGSCQTALLLAENYDGAVQVVNNQRISVTQKQSVRDAVSLAQKGWNAGAIKEKLEQEKMESSIYIMLDTMKYLRKGGRITPAAAALGMALRLKPVLQIQGEKLDAFAIAKTSKKGIAKMLDAMADDIENRFGGVENVTLHVAHTKNEEMAQQFCHTIRDKFGLTGDIVMDPLSLSVSCHIGPGALAIACSKKIEVL